MAHTVATARSASLRSSRQLAIATLVVLAAFRLVVLVLVISQGHTSDTARFFALGHAAGRPYTDYAVEYPPLFLAVLKLLAFTTPSEPTFTAAIGIVALLAEAAIAAMLWRAWSTRAAVWFLAVDTLVLGLFALRLDLLSVALVVAAVVSALRSRPSFAAVLMVAAIGLKLWPAPLALVLLVLLHREQRQRYMVTGGVCLAVLCAAWFSLGGVAGIEQVLTFRGAGGWQIESVVGSVVHVFTHEPVILQAGAARFGHVPPVLTVLMDGAAVALTLWVVAHVRDWRDLGAAWVACVGAFLIASSLFSPQFTAWLIPAGAIAWVAGDGAVAAAIAAISVSTVLENSAYGELSVMTAEGMVLVLLRNLVLVLTVVVATVTLSRHRRVPEASSRLAAQVPRVGRRALRLRVAEPLQWRGRPGPTGH